MVDLPTFGRPIRPTSAIVINSNSTSHSFVFCPPWAKRGACFVGVANLAFPLPPLPPRRTVRSLPGLFISAIILPDSTSRTRVPTGTLITRFSPLLPYCMFPLPFSPFCARKNRANLKSSSVFMFSSARKTTLPPLPPSPPSGPP